MTIKASRKMLERFFLEGLNDENTVCVGGYQSLTYAQTSSQLSNLSLSRMQDQDKMNVSVEQKCEDVRAHLEKTQETPSCAEDDGDVFEFSNVVEVIRPGLPIRYDMDDHITEDILSKFKPFEGEDIK